MVSVCIFLLLFLLVLIKRIHFLISDNLFYLMQGRKRGWQEGVLHWF